MGRAVGTYPENVATDVLPEMKLLPWICPSWKTLMQREQQNEMVLTEETPVKTRTSSSILLVSQIVSVFHPL